METLAHWWEYKLMQALWKSLEITNKVAGTVAYSEVYQVLGLRLCQCCCPLGTLCFSFFSFLGTPSMSQQFHYQEF